MRSVEQMITFGEFMELFIRLLVIKRHRDWFNNVPV